MNAAMFRESRNRAMQALGKVFRSMTGEQHIYYNQLLTLGRPHNVVKTCINGS